MEKNDAEEVIAVYYRGQENMGEMIVACLKENGIEANHVHFLDVESPWTGVVHILKRDEIKARQLIEGFEKEWRVLGSEEGEEWKIIGNYSQHAYYEKEGKPHEKNVWPSIVVGIIIVAILLGILCLVKFGAVEFELGKSDYPTLVSKGKRITGTIIRYDDQCIQGALFGGMRPPSDICANIEYENDFGIEMKIKERWPFSLMIQHRVGDLIDLLYFEGNEIVKAASFHNRWLIGEVNVSQKRVS